MRLPSLSYAEKLKNLYTVEPDQVKSQVVLLTSIPVLIEKNIIASLEYKIQKRVVFSTQTLAF